MLLALARGAFLLRKAVCGLLAFFLELGDALSQRVDLALQGPASLAILQSLTEADLSADRVAGGNGHGHHERGIGRERQ